MRFAFVEEHRRHIPVNRLCQIVEVSPRGYRAWRSRPISASRRNDMVVLAHIRDQFERSLGSYGRARMTEELKELEQFQEKWPPVFRPELRENKKIEHFR